MKNSSKHILLTLFLLAPLSGLLPASAQGWLWGRAGTGVDAGGYAAATDPSGNVYGAGNKAAFGTFLLPSLDFGWGVTVPYLPGITPGIHYQAIWVKYNNSGTALWAGGTLSGETQIFSIATDPSGNLIVFGEFDSPTMQIGPFTLTNAYGTSSDFQYFLARISPAGTVLWAHNDGNVLQAGTTALVGDHICSTGVVTTDTSGNIYISSSFNKATISIGSTTLTNAAAGSRDVFIAKYTPAGTLVWATSFGGTQDEEVYGITACAGSVYVCGSLASPSVTIGPVVMTNPNPWTYYTLAYIAKFSDAGIPLWAQDAGGESGAFAAGLASDNYGNVYMAGGFVDSSISFGSTTITKTYPPPYPPYGLEALFLVRYSSSGIVDWGKTIGSPHQPVDAFNVAVSACGTVWVSGRYRDTASIDGNILLANYSLLLDPTLIAGYDIHSGMLVGYSVLNLGGSFQNAIACDSSGNVFMCGGNDYVPIFIGPDTLAGGPAPYWNAFFMAKYASAAGADTAHIHQDTTYCGADSIIISAPAGYAKYHWDNGTTDSVRKVNATSSGTYYVFCVSCGYVLEDSIIVTVPRDTSGHRTDTTICSNAGIVVLAAPPGYSSWLWNTGGIDSTITISAPGSYFVYCARGCHILADTFNVGVYDHISAGFDLVASVNCDRDSVSFTNTSQHTTKFLWTFGDGTTDAATNPVHLYYPVLDTTLFTVTLRSYDTVCNYDSIAAKLLTLYPVSPKRFLYGIIPDQAIPYGKSMQLDVRGGWIYYWTPENGTLDNPNINNPIAAPLEKTTYVVYGYDHAGCIDSAQVTVDVITTEEVIPSAFTPNGDGLNDVFRVANLRGGRLVEMNIYNQWGQLVCKTSDNEKGWNGTFEGVSQDMGVYNYYIVIERENHKTVYYKGTLTLIR
jgi:gliding motility-associated-like protein